MDDNNNNSNNNYNNKVIFGQIPFIDNNTEAVCVYLANYSTPLNIRQPMVRDKI